MLAPFGMRPKGTVLARMLPLAQALARRGHTVDIIAPPVQNPEDAGRCELLGGVCVRHTGLPRLSGPPGIAQQVALLLQPALTARPDLLHLFKPKGYSGLAALVARWVRPALPLVVDTDDWEGWGGWNDLLPYPRMAKALFAWQERDLPRRADAVTVASRTLQTQVWGFGVPPERVFYVPNGCQGPGSAGQVGAGRYLIPAARNPRILLYTRFWEFDLHSVVAALVAIHGCRPDARLLVVGKGERGEEQALLRLAARAGVAGALDYRGWVAPETIPAILDAADLALVPLDDTLINRARGLAKLLELMQAGLPIVASNVGQSAEYLTDGRSGLLTPPGNPGALARAAIDLLESADLRARLGAGARQAAEAFAWDRLATTVEQVYAWASAESVRV
jgi:glycosyltransferase involved in cell wall biosynthesis